MIIMVLVFIASLDSLLFQSLLFTLLSLSFCSHRRLLADDLSAAAGAAAAGLGGKLLGQQRRLQQWTALSGVFEGHAASLR